MIQTILHILPWALPVILGAAIGYITNAIAIRMLFRPLEEKRIFGIRIPFTPGIIPKQRYQLSGNLGVMVAEELITEDAIKDQLSRDRFTKGFKNAVSSMTEKLFSRPVTFKDKNRLADLLGPIRAFISDLLFRFFNSRTFIYAVRDITSRTVEYLLSLKVIRLMEKIKWQEFLSVKLKEILESGGIKDLVINKIFKYLTGLKESDKKMSHILSGGLVHSAADIFGTMLPELFDSLFKWLRTDAMHRELEVRGRFMLRDILDRLNILQKFLITAGQFDKSLEERMPEIIDDVLEHFERMVYRDNTRQGMVRSLEKALVNWTEKPVKDVLSCDDKTILSRLEDIYSTVVDVFGGKMGTDTAVKYIRNWLELHDQATLRDIVVKKAHIAENGIKEFLSFTILNFITDRSTIDGSLDKITRFVENYFTGEKFVTLNVLFKITSSDKERIDNFLAKKAYMFIVDNIPEIINALDVKKLVVEKVDKLNVIEVENLLLQVMAKHFKWINIFGAILGAFIGATQIIIRLLGV